jgi:hypothetical protein
MSKKVIKPGKWWIIQLRAIKTYNQVGCVLVCRNAAHAGHRSSKHKTRRKYDRLRGRYIHRKVPRKWDLRHPRSGVPYKFDELSEARKCARVDVIKNWVTAHDGYVEIVEREGCLFYGTVTSETVIERKFRRGTNEMVILALESC